MKKQIPLIAVLPFLLAGAALVLAVGAFTTPRQYEQQSLQLLQTAQIIYAADANTTYVAIAADPGTAATAARWQCKKIATSGLATLITWADGNNLFDNVPAAGGIGLPGLSYQ